MSSIKVTGIGRAYDGEYEFDGTYFTNKELHTIKRMSGVRAGEIPAALEAGDNDLVVALTVIALERNGKVVNEDALWNAKVGCIEAMLGEADADEADDADPPTLGLDESSSEKKPSSGPSSEDGSASQANVQSRTGLQPSELSAA
jgi:hypothetical protein